MAKNIINFPTDTDVYTFSVCYLYLHQLWQRQPMHYDTATGCKRPGLNLIQFQSVNRLFTLRASVKPEVFCQERCDEPFRLAVCPRSAGAGSLVRNAGLAASLTGFG